MVTREGLIQESVRESKDKKGRAVLAVITALMALLFLTVAVLAYFVYSDYHQAAQRGTNLAQQVKNACADPRVDTADLGSLCEKADKVVEEAPVQPTIKGEKGDEGSPGDTGPSGPPPSAEQVAQAVKEYCATGACQGAVTSQQVSAAVLQYCSNHNACKGDSGSVGEVGARGEKGDTGATGQAGQDGKDGTDGKNGANAYPFTFTFTIHDDLGASETTYLCTVADTSTTTTCVEQAQ